MTEEKIKKLKRKRLRNNILFTIIFLIGLVVLAYPQISRIYYRIAANEQVATFESEKNKINEKEIDERMKLAEAYNQGLSNENLEDPYDEETRKLGMAHYAKMLEIQEKIGVIEIPTIDIKIPLYAGTSETVLQMGAGHLENTSLPIGGNSTHSVISAHSGLPNARLFSDLEDLKIGDKFYIHNIKETLAYVVDEITVVEPTDFSRLLISPGHDYVTLLTCTPYMVNTHRLLVRGHRVEFVPEVEERIIAENRASFTYRYLFYAALVIIALLLIYLLFLRRRKKKVEQEIRATKKRQQEELEKLNTIETENKNEESRDLWKNLWKN